MGVFWLASGPAFVLVMRSVVLPHPLHLSMVSSVAIVGALRHLGPANRGGVWQQERPADPPPGGKMVLCPPGFRTFRIARGDSGLPHPGNPSGLGSFGESHLAPPNALRKCFGQSPGVAPVPFVASGFDGLQATFQVVFLAWLQSHIVILGTAIGNPRGAPQRTRPPQGRGRTSLGPALQQG